MTAKEKAASRRVIKAATPGPWVYGWKDPAEGRWIDYRDCRPYVSAIRVWHPTVVIGNRKRTITKAQRDADARFIACARTGWPAALDALDEAEKEIKRLKKALWKNRGLL